MIRIIPIVGRCYITSCIAPAEGILATTATGISAAPTANILAATTVTRPAHTVKAAMVPAMGEAMGTGMAVGMAVGMAEAAMVADISSVKRVMMRANREGGAFPNAN